MTCADTRSGPTIMISNVEPGTIFRRSQMQRNRLQNKDLHAGNLLESIFGVDICGGVKKVGLGRKRN